MAYMRTALLLILFLANTLLAQTFFPSFFPPQLKEYFAFSDDQITKINNLNQQLQSFRLGKALRQAQVQREIAEESAKDNPNPTALGQSYIELEAIRRELEAEQQKTVRQVQAVLTADQRVKLTVLEQALALQSTACTAAGQNLLTPPPSVIRNPFPGNVIPASRLSLESLISLGTCGISGLTAIISPNPLVP